TWAARSVRDGGSQPKPEGAGVCRDLCRSRVPGQKVDIGGIRPAHKDVEGGILMSLQEFHQSGVMDTPVTIGVSSCLLGENVRYDGELRLDRNITDTLGK